MTRAPAPSDAPARPARVTAGSVGSDSLRALPSRLLSETTDRLGPQVALREFADPPHAAFVLPPSDAVAVILVTRGDYVLETGRPGARSHALMAPGSSSVTRPGKEVHAGWHAEGREHFRSVHLHASRALLERAADELGAPRTTAPDYLHRGDGFLSAVMGQLTADLRTAAPRLHLDTLVQTLLHHLLLHERAAPRAPRPMTARALREVVDRMRAGVEEPLTLEELAAVAHLSPHHFLRRFTAATGSSPMRFLTRIRMERAAELLLDDSLSVHEVALRCGYANPSGFAAAFRRHTGATPTEHRRRRRI